MKILVTGGAGFIGSNVVDAYIDKGYEVVVVDDLSSGKKENLNKKAKFYKLDICDKALEEAFEEGIDIVNHHAAQVDVRRSIADPAVDARINIEGSLNILENCRKYNIKKIIFASSGGVIYGECGSVPPNEDSPTSPISPYGISKYAMECYLSSYEKIYGLRYTALRYGNVYGPRQDPYGEAGVVAIFSRKMLNNEEVDIFGDGEQVRDYVYVGDVVKANILCLENGNNEIFNIGTGKCTSVNQLFSEMKQLTHYSKEAVYKPRRAGELIRSSLDVGKAEKKLGWKEEVNLTQGLKKTIDFFMKH
ncbi:NAD-dependent epimerase/dehydratase family protein [bacterium]|nr:NAD-dependent epimerase/dehydratase family protein [bacterium]NIN91845.1 NAD-dependent epimerase/dehydratase family protein [bacterium]NIO17941.1 NAD-dependent epimerase/dehydratase family protein [bacterium]NIO73096.1 NAD-dependent epimerase/dehydratase family protein [bacterium]